jgi:plastocyanin
VLTELSLPVFYVPGEHDVLEDDGKRYLQRFGKGTPGGGWYSFDQAGVHFIGLVNVLNLSTEQQFKSPVLDTDQQFSHTFDAPGTYYFCSIHPKMTGQVVVA